MNPKLSKISNTRHKYEGNERAKLEDRWPIGYAKGKIFLKFQPRTTTTTKIKNDCGFFDIIFNITIRHTK